MAALNDKRLGLLYCYFVLYKYSSSSRRLKQEEVANYLLHDYNLELERKAVGRALNLLSDPEEFGEEFGVERDNGYYVKKRLFSDSQLRMLTDIVLSSSYISAEEAKDMIASFAKLGSADFKSRVKNTSFVGSFNRTQNSDISEKLDMLDEAIRNEKTIKFNYTKYNHEGKRVKTSEQTVSPYQLIVKNQRYYLFAHNERWNDDSFYHIDRMTNLEFADAPYTDSTRSPMFRGGIDYEKLSRCLPYPFADKLVGAEFTIPKGVDMENEVYESFGNMARFTEQNGLMHVNVQVSYEAMKHWALNFLDKVEVIKPTELRAELRDIISGANKRYND